MLTMLGSAGVTIVPMTVEPGACYLVAATVTKGEARAGRLAVRVGLDVRYDDMNELPRSGAVSFCAGPRDHVAKIQIDVRARSGRGVMTSWRVTK